MATKLLSTRIVIALAATAPRGNVRISAYLERAKALAADGLRLSEVGDLFLGLIDLAVSEAANLPLSSPEKKATVEAAVARLYDTVAPSIPWPMWASIVRPFMAPAIRGIVLALADGMIEVVYARLQRTDPPSQTQPLN